MRRYSWEGWHAAVSSNGHPYRTWEPPTPYINPQYRDCAIYLYPSEREAREGVAAGGSGFLVGMDSPVEGESHMYAVTNEHVARPASGRPNLFIRLNDKGGKADVLKVKKKSAWIPHPGGDDLAATPVEVSQHHQVRYIDRPMFMTPEILDEYQIGPGDECFMVGRLMQYDGKQRNEPVLRFGNLAMMPYPVYQPTRQRHQESFLVEMRTLSGFSGSPVIVHYVTVGTRASSEAIEGGRPYGASLVTNMPWLLGVDWGFVQACPDVHGGQDDRRLVNSGMSGVVPAWKLAELLDDPKLAKARERRDRELAARREGAAVEAGASHEQGQ